MNPTDFGRVEMPNRGERGRGHVLQLRIPQRPQGAFKYNRKLLGELCRLALRSLTRYFALVTGSELTPGVIAAIQTFGDRINLHPHLHFLVTEGGVDEAGVFHKIPRIDDSRLAELVRKELLSPEWGERILAWRLSLSGLSRTSSNVAF